MGSCIRRSWHSCESKHTWQERALQQTELEEDSGGHILGACLHKDMNKQYIARHDKAIRAVVQAFTNLKGRHGGFYLSADVGHLESLKELGVQSKRVATCVLPNRYLHNRGADPG